MADFFFHTGSLRTLEIPGGGVGEFGVKLSSNPGLCVKRESNIFSISRGGDFVLFGNSRVGNSGDGGSFLIKSLSSAPPPV